MALHCEGTRISRYRSKCACKHIEIHPLLTFFSCSRRSPQIRHHESMVQCHSESLKVYVLTVGPS